MSWHLSSLPLVCWQKGKGDGTHLGVPDLDHQLPTQDLVAMLVEPIVRGLAAGRIMLMRFGRASVAVPMPDVDGCSQNTSILW